MDTSQPGNGFSIASMSWYGLTLYRALGQYAQTHKPMRPQLYQIEGLFILHTDQGREDYVLHPNTDALGLTNDPPQPLPVDLVVLTAPTDKSDFRAQLHNCFAAAVQQVWHLDALNKALTVYRPEAEARLYQKGERLSGGDLLPDFTLELSQIFGG